MTCDAQCEGQRLRWKNSQHLTEACAFLAGCYFLPLAVTLNLKNMTSPSNTV